MEEHPEVTLATSEEDLAFTKFKNFHALQLYGIQFPPALERKLFDKLKGEIFDIGFKVKIMVDHEEEKVDLQCACPQLKANEDVFLVDHAWTFKQRDAEKTLRQNDKLLERMLNIVRYSEKQDLPTNPYEKARPTLIEAMRAFNDETTEYDLDEYGIKSLKHIPFSQRAETISLFNNGIENPGEITSALTELPRLKALWLNGNPVVDNCVNFNQIGEFLPALEVINSKFTSRAGEWALLYYAKEQGVKTLEEIRALDLSGKGILYLRDISIFERLASLQTLDISGHPEFLQTDSEIEEEESKLKEGSPQQDQIEFSKRLHTIDELLSKLNSVRKLTCDAELEAYIIEHRPSKGFLPALREVNGVSIKVTDAAQRSRERDIRQVMQKLWMYVGTYRLVTEEQMDEENIWYINDEVGCSIRHSDSPNFAIHPFIYAPNGTFDAHTITYSICWPLSDLNEGDVIFRDYLKGYDETKFRSTRFSVWFNTPEEYFKEQLRIFREFKPFADALTLHNEYQEQYAPLPSIDSGSKPLQLPIKVYSDYTQVLDNLKDPARFEFVEDPSEATIFWGSADQKKIEQIKGGEDSLFFYNYFQYESAFVAKHHLADMVRQVFGHENSVIQETFVLNDSLPAFVGRFQERQHQARDNTWILKPTNMARSMDTWVSTNLDHMLRLSETGPKIAQKYIERPCLFRGRKFDMRFVVLVKSVLPLELYVYEEFYTRHSNNSFEMDESTLSVYETHFTVMNYAEGVTITNIRYFDFEKEFNQENEGKITMAEVRERIHQAIKQVFIAFQVQHGKDFKTQLERAQKSRGLYGVDVMITEDYEPKILEVTFSPDCGRACKFNPNFFNEVFGCLFFNDAKNMIRL